MSIERQNPTLFNKAITKNLIGETKASFCHAVSITYLH